MILQTRQKKALLATLDERSSPFADTKTQKIFKNTANLTLKGNTYDAIHLDQFLNSQYCSKPDSMTHLYQTRKSQGLSQTQSLTGAKKYTLNSSMVRPSIAFISQNRDNHSQQIYID